MKVIALSLCLLMSGCALSRGALTGLLGGPAIIDEMTTNAYSRDGWKSNIKQSLHTFAGVTLCLINPIIGGLYLGGSAAYGAYEYHVKAKPKK